MVISKHCFAVIGSVSHTFHTYGLTSEVEHTYGNVKYSTVQSIWICCDNLYDGTSDGYARWSWYQIGMEMSQHFVMTAQSPEKSSPTPK